MKPLEAASSSLTRCAVVTGATGIIGPTVCRMLEEAGWKVAASAFDPAGRDPFEKPVGGPVRCSLRITADLSIAAECRRVVEEAQAVLGPVGAVIHLAHTDPGGRKLEEITPDYCERLLRVDLLAPIYLVQAAAGSLQREGGAVVLFSSVLSERLPGGKLVYACSKAGVERMARALLAEMDGSAVRVNTLRVGAISGVVQQAMATLSPERAKRMARAIRGDGFRTRIAEVGVPPVGTPEDIGSLVVFLCSDEARFINGSVIPVDGAYSLYPLPNRQENRRKIGEVVRELIEADGAGR